MSILETLLGALGGGVLGTAATAYAKRSASRDASATAVVEPLLKRIDTLERDRDEDRREMKAAQEAHRKQREEDQAECVRTTAIAVRENVEAATAPFRSALAEVLERVAETRESVHGEDTGVHMLRERAAEVRRASTPPEGTDRRSLPPLPPPKRDKETDR